jgi:hypothetical protein
MSIAPLVGMNACIHALIANRYVSRARPREQSQNSGRKKVRVVVPVGVITGAHNCSPKGIKRGCESVINLTVEGSFT